MGRAVVGASALGELYLPKAKRTAPFIVQLHSRRTRQNMSVAELLLKSGGVGGEEERAMVLVHYEVNTTMLS